MCEPDLKIGLVTFGMPRTLANGETEEELAAAAAAALDRANESLTAAEAAPAAAGGALKNDSNGFYADVNSIACLHILLYSKTFFKNYF